MKLQTAAVPGSESFAANRAQHLELIEKVRSAASAASLGGGDGPRERHLSRGKMLPRDRVANLLDPGSPFQCKANPRS